MASFNVTFQTTDDFRIGFQDSGDSFPAFFDNVISSETYHGEYEFVPSNEEQTIETKGLLLTNDITIQPIPSNYGLITWNGATLTVS